VLLAQIIKDLKPSTPYVEGIFSGKDEFQLEISKSHLNDLNSLRNKTKDQDLNREI
jgi:hypothetical protein